MASINVMRAFREKPAPLDFVLPGLMAGTVGAIVSPGGAGKSMLALEMAAYIASGIDMTGFCQGEHMQGRAAFLAAEDPPEAIAHRIHAIGQQLQSNLSDNRSQLAMELIAEKVVIESLLGYQIDIKNPKWIKFIESMATDRRILFIDTLRRFHQSDENNSGDMAQVLGVLEGIAQRTHCAIVFLHHASKAAALSGQGDMQQASRGSSALVDNVRWQMYLSGCSKDEAKKLDIDEAMRGYFVRAGVSKQNYGPPVADVWMRRIDGGVLMPAKFATSTVTAKPLITKGSKDSSKKKDWL